MTRKIALLAVVLALVWGLSACGSSATDTAGSPSTSTTSSSMPMPSSPSTTTKPGTESPSATAGSGEAVISIAAFKFTVPASVAPGAQIIIKNGDSQAHTVTSKTGGFDVKVDPDGTATLTAPSKPGSYPFVCSFHGNMTSTLVVKWPHPPPSLQPTAQEGVPLTLRWVVAASRAVDAVIRFRLAGEDQQSAPGGIGAGNRFRIQAVLTLVVAVGALAR